MTQRAIRLSELRQTLRAYDDRADRGIPQDELLRAVGFENPAGVSGIAFQRALRGYAILTGQMAPRPGYQPVRLQPPVTEQQRFTWAILSAMWLDGATGAAWHLNGATPPTGHEGDAQGHQFITLRLCTHCGRIEGEAQEAPHGAHA
jgi:hypothetical protein